MSVQVVIASAASITKDVASSPEPSADAAASPSPFNPPHVFANRLKGKQPLEEAPVAQAAVEGSVAEKTEDLADPATGPAEDEATSQTLSQQLAKLYGLQRLRNEEAICKASLEELLKDGAAKKPSEHDIKKCMSLHQLKEVCNDVLAVEEQSIFHTFQDDFEDALEVAQELMQSVQSAANDVTSHW